MPGKKLYPLEIKKPRWENPPGLEIKGQRPTLPPGLPGSTIGAGGLNFSVRNGKRCFPSAIATPKRMTPNDETWATRNAPKKNRSSLTAD